jgi:outer membrane lipoprotein SlyB
MVRFLARDTALRASVIASFMLVSGCAVAPPTGPDIAVMPGPGKNLAQFQQDDVTCRQYASGATNGASPAQAANQSAIGSAAVGTALGAAAGAAIGAASGSAGAGAAIGAGAGLLTGSAVGLGNGAESSAGLQSRYDVAYAQCMTAQGNKAPEPSGYAAYAPAPPRTYYAYPPPVGYYPPYYAYPPVIIGGYWGWHGRFRR